MPAASWGRLTGPALAFFGAMPSPVPSARGEDRQITWLLNDFPPAMILEDGLPGRGFMVEFVLHVYERMPEYRHLFAVTSLADAMVLMSRGEPACHPSLLATAERDAYITFSAPTIFSLPHHVVVRVDQRRLFDPFLAEGGTVDVARLVAAPELVTTVSEDRAFPPVLVAALAATGKAGSYLVRAPIDFRIPIRQLAAGWIDYVFAYPLEVRWFMEKEASTPGADTEFAYLPIEGMPDHVIGRVGCTKGLWGETVIARIDEIVAAAGPRPRWLESMFRSMDDNARRRSEALFLQLQPFGRLDP